MSGMFKPRPTRATGVITINGWQLKNYEITLDGNDIAKDLIGAAHATLVDTLPTSPSLEPAVGFAILHRGLDGVWLLADLWNGDILHQHTFTSRLSATLPVFTLVPVGGPTACVWELTIHSHERDAYIRHILDPLTGPDIDAYLSDVLVVG